METPEDPFHLSDMYDRCVADIASDRLKSKSKPELLEMRRVLVATHSYNKLYSSAGPFIQILEDELARRDKAFTERLMLWAAIAAAIFGAIAAWPVVQGWLPTSQHAGKDASSQSPQSNSPPSGSPVKP